MFLVESERTPALAAALLLLGALSSGSVAFALPDEAPDTLAQALEAADMTFLLEKVDGASTYDVATPDGYTFKLSEVEDRYTFTLLEATAGNPRSGLWFPSFYVDTVACPGKQQLAGQVHLMMGRMDEMLIPLMGGSRQAMTVPYEFEAPFYAKQLLAPIWRVMTMAEYHPSANYPASGQANVFPFTLEIDSGQLLTAVKGEIAVLSSEYIVGVWSGRNGECSASGLATWSRREG